MKGLTTSKPRSIDKPVPVNLGVLMKGPSTSKPRSIDERPQYQ